MTAERTVLWMKSFFNHMKVFIHGSAASGTQVARAGLMITANDAETARHVS